MTTSGAFWSRSIRDVLAGKFSRDVGAHTQSTAARWSVCPKTRTSTCTRVTAKIWSKLWGVSSFLHPAKMLQRGRPEWPCCWSTQVAFPVPAQIKSLATSLPWLSALRSLWGWCWCQLALPMVPGLENTSSGRRSEKRQQFPARANQAEMFSHEVLWGCRSWKSMKGRKGWWAEREKLIERKLMLLSPRGNVRTPPWRPGKAVKPHWTQHCRFAEPITETKWC